MVRDGVGQSAAKVMVCIMTRQRVHMRTICVAHHIAYQAAFQRMWADFLVWSRSKRQAHQFLMERLADGTTLKCDKKDVAKEMMAQLVRDISSLDRLLNTHSARPRPALYSSGRWSLVVLDAARRVQTATTSSPEEARRSWCALPAIYPW